jgi:outer membrane protein insertion porin family
MASASLQYDTRNHPRQPNRGFYFIVSNDLAGIGGDVQFIRVTAEGRAYYPIAEKVTLVGRVIGGHIQGWGGDDVRLTDLFYKGGETIRGFERSGLGPRDLLTGDALGGTTFWAATAEVRFPIPFLPDNLGISGAAFADAGSIFGASDIAKEFVGGDLADDSSIRASAGLSLLWNSPLGPLRLDYAFPLQTDAFNDDSGRFQFTMGAVF